MSDSLASRTGVRLERDASSELLQGRTGASHERGTAQPYSATSRRVQHPTEESSNLAPDTIASSSSHQHTASPASDSFVPPPHPQEMPSSVSAAPAAVPPQQQQSTATVSEPAHQSPQEPSQVPPSGADAHSSLSQLFANFMNSMRHAAGLAEQTQPQHPVDAPPANSDAAQDAPQTAQDSAQTATQGEARPPPSVLYFRLPFNGPDGNPALLAFHPMPLPPGSSPASEQEAPQPNAREENATFPHPSGHVPRAPLFVPYGASPLPFSFIYDAPTNTAWPIAQVVPMSPPGGPSPDSAQAPQLVAGPPFRIILDLHFSAPPAPDPLKASTYVNSLEKADSHLRHRLSLLGGDSSPLSCGVCLENYGEEDRPDWIAGKDEGVVAVPCGGHHTLHKKCLEDWLSRTVKWSCPFCRDELGGEDKGSLRETVRQKERERGWRCDAPACLPRYPGEGEEKEELVKLTPCRHQVHLDCLCTSMRVEADLCEGRMAEVEDDEQDTTGKWVTCPCCRKESWASLPVRKKPKRSRDVDTPMSITPAPTPTRMGSPVSHPTEEEQVEASL